MPMTEWDHEKQGYTGDAPKDCKHEQSGVSADDLHLYCRECGECLDGPDEDPEDAPDEPATCPYCREEVADVPTGVNVTCVTCGASFMATEPE